MGASSRSCASPAVEITLGGTGRAHRTSRNSCRNLGRGQGWIEEKGTGGLRLWLLPNLLWAALRLSFPGENSQSTGHAGLLSCGSAFLAGMTLD